MNVFESCECCVLSGRGLCDGPIPRPEESYRLWCVIVCDPETPRMRRPWPALGCCAREGNLVVILVFRREINPPYWRLRTSSPVSCVNTLLAERGDCVGTYRSDLAVSERIPPSFLSSNIWSHAAVYCLCWLLKILALWT
jgi:hypothetical protein